MGDSTELSAEERQRVEERVRGMVAELRAMPTAQKEDALGLEIATMAPAEREYVPSVLLRIVAEEGRRGAFSPSSGEGR